MKKNPVVHFEMPYEDSKRASDFYSKVFGWQMQYFPEMGKYIVATTTESDDNGPKEPGAINGGFYPTGVGGATDTTVIIEVEDIKEMVKAVTDGGGKVLGEVIDIPGVGLYTSFHDSEGNRVGLLEPHKH